MRQEIRERERFLATRVFFSLVPTFRIMSPPPQSRLLLYSRQKLFRLKEDIRVYADVDQNHEVLHIQARQIIDFSAAYDVFDSETKEKAGTLRRKGWRSLVRDKWEVLDREEKLIAVLEEDSLFLALVRRWFMNLIPQTYNLVNPQGVSLGRISQRFNLFVHKFDVDFSQDRNRILDRRLGLALVILLLAIERRQS